MKYTILVLLMLFSGWTQSAIKPVNGLWRSTDDPDIGSGFMTVTQGGITFVSLFTYTEFGLPRWYLAVGSVDENGLYQASLIETLNGSNIQTESPTSAEISTISRDLSIQFAGTQTATFKLDDGHNKSMQAYQFGYPTWQTEHLTLNDGNDYSFADLSGKWVVADEISGESFILELAEVENDSSVSRAFLEKTYVSSFLSTDGWNMSCPWRFFPTTLPFSQPFCTLDRNDEGLPLLKVPFVELGGRKINLLSDVDDQSFTGFRVEESPRLIPNDGLWRAEDDPAIGSGLVMTTQGDVTAILLYSYDDAGQATWSVASGVFDENGLIETELLFTEGGSPIEVNGKTTATFTGQNQSLTVQMLGSELATFSIEGSVPKHIQNNNFGSYIYDTEHLKINSQNFQLPSIHGNWLMLNSQDGKSSVLEIGGLNGSITPLPPSRPQVFSGSSLGDNDRYYMDLSCHTEVYLEVTYDGCTGSGNYTNQSEDDQLVLYFQDVGHDYFRLYYGESIDSINRNSPYYEYFRLSE